MPDDKKEGGDPREREKPTVKPEEVQVTVVPKKKPTPDGANKRDAHRVKRENDGNQQRADKATGNDQGGATKEVRDAIRKATPGGRDAQQEAAKEAAKEVGKKLDSKVFDGVKVKMPDEKVPIMAPATEGATPSADPPPPPPKSKGI